jgi:hypothetical protein
MPAEAEKEFVFDEGEGGEDACEQDGSGEDDWFHWVCGLFETF